MYSYLVTNEWTINHFIKSVFDPYCPKYGLLLKRLYLYIQEFREIREYFMVAYIYRRWHFLICFVHVKKYVYT